ncbi:FAD-binding oxidoreductase [Streptomyces sp. NPDC090306]|uniref:FAD-binding oxidoreductase n=1 Tax=Streptomyces sp. NPDC090306 TaxID=3365961 RepID=UPI00380A00A7
MTAAPPAVTTADVRLLARRLSAVVGDAHVLADADLRAPYERDFTGRWQGGSLLVVRPADTAQTAEVLRLCAGAGVAVVPQGGNTGLVGASVPGGDARGEVLLSLRRLDGVGPVDPRARRVTVGAGVTLAALQHQVRPHGLEFGVDLASRDSATLGGMAATNAGGERVVRYGTTRANVAGVEAVTADGRVLDRLAGLPKDNTGYDLAGLLVGSEGTLAVLTRLRLVLRTRPPRRTAALLAVDSVAAAVAALEPLRRLESLELAEFFTADGLALVLAHGSLPAPFRTAHPVYLLVECAAAHDPTEELADAVALCAAREVAVATDGGARRRLAAYRERHTEAVNSLGPPLKFDVTLPLPELPRFVDELPGLLAGRARAVVFGHLAEGNVHLNLVGAARSDEEPLARAVLGRVADAGGSISAEHGVGRAKAAYVPLTRGADDVALMRAVKAAWDPAGILNPGAMLPSPPPPGARPRPA